MKQQMRWVLLVLWVAVTVIFIGLASQIRAEVNAESNGNDWVQTNGPYGGDINALYAAPKGVLLIGTRGAGIFRSTDRGNFWTPVNTGLDFEPGEGFVTVTAFAQKGKTLYIGTSGALYASTGDGDIWRQVPTSHPYVSISGIVVIGERIYIGTLNTGVWYSDDDGDSWLPMNDGLGHTLVRTLSRIGTTLVAGTQDGAFRKRGHEDSWTPINAGFVAQPIDAEPINNARIQAGLDPLPKQEFPSGIRVDAFAAMEDLLYVGVYMGEDHGLFRSDDEGDSWTRITAEEMTHTVEELAVYGGTLYASTYGGGVFRSDDEGDSWTVVNNGLTNQTVSALLAVNEDTVFVGTSGGGVFRTMDGGNSWMETNTGLTNTSVGELEVIGSTIYAGIYERLVYSVDSGASWQSVKIPSMPIQYGFSALSVSDRELYMGAIRFAPRDLGGVVGGIFQLDGDNTALVELIAHRDLTGIQCMEVVGKTFYIGTQGGGIFQWDKDSGPWTTNLGLERHFITTLLVNGENIYAGTERGGIYRAKGTGKPWERINPDMMDTGISALESVGSTFYVASWDKGVFHSVNGGDSWTPLNDGLDGTSVTTMETVGRALYVGTFSSGVFRWIEDKKLWKPMGSLRRQVMSLAVLDGFLYAGTATGGVFKIRIAE